MIPIVCSFNTNYTLPAIVFLTSLCENANTDTQYKVYVLYSSLRLSDENIDKVKKIEECFANIRIDFIDVQDEFLGMYESRHLTIDAYYRLLIPEIVSEKKVIYLDVDLIVKRDLFALYNTPMNGKMIAGVKDALTEKQKSYQTRIGNKPNEYINSGVLLIDIAKIRELNFQSKYQDHIANDYENHDQDIINKIYQGQILFIEAGYNYTFQHLNQNVMCESPHVIHYTIFKPWSYLCAFSDEWWMYYKKSIAFSLDFYHNFQKENFSDLNRHLRLGKILKSIGLYRIMDIFKPN